MAHLKLGSEGQEVSDLQARLRELGFDAEGEFGPVTDFAVRRFQERTGLLPDGIVGPLTRAELDRFGAGDPMLEEGDEPDDAGPPVDRSLRLPAGQFVEEVRPKDLVVLHHTAGASARSTFDFWRDTPPRIATAYIVERDGTIFEVFDPRFWAFHLGVVGNGNRIDRRSIGVELASEGALTKDGDDFFAFRTQENPRGTRFEGEVLELDEPFRNERFFAAYTREQLDAAIELVDHLCTVFGIPRRTPADRLAFAEANVEFQGVIGHHHVRRDKTDVHPGFPWGMLVERAGLERV